MAGCPVTSDDFLCDECLIMRKTLFACGSFLFFLWLGDMVLGLFVKTPQCAHPPNLRERRQNLEYGYSFNTNSQGLRSPEIPLEKPSARRRILVLGDSFVEGVGVEAEECFVSLLERRYGGSQVDFINGGLGGTGPEEYLDLLLEAGGCYDPDAVIVFVYANDVANTPEGHPWWRALVRRALPNIYRIVRGRVRPKRVPTAGSSWLETVLRQARLQGITEERIRQWQSRLPARLVEAVAKGRFLASTLSNGLLRPDYWTSSLDIDSSAAERRWYRMVEALDGILDYCRKRRIPTSVVFIPVVFQYAAGSHSPDHPVVIGGSIIRRRWLRGRVELQNRLEGWSAARNVPFLDLTGVLREEAARGGPPINFKMDFHLTREGNKIVAKRVGRWLEEMRVFSFLVPAIAGGAL